MWRSLCHGFASCRPFNRKWTSHPFPGWSPLPLSLELIRKARANNVILQCLPPNTNHLLQLLDLGVFAPVKSAWKSILKRYKLETRGEQVSKEVFPSLVAQLWDASFKPDHCKGGFHGAGPVPFLRKHVLQKVAPSRSTEGNRDRICSGDSSKVKCTNCGHEMATTPITLLSH